jgi:hypothetical protein
VEGSITKSMRGVRNSANEGGKVSQVVFGTGMA